MDRISQARQGFLEKNLAKTEISHSKNAIIFSLIISAVTLFSVGFYKAKITTNSKFLKSGLEILIIGLLSAFIGYFIGSLFKINSTY
ncbi:hypothetical protein A3D78_02400 [Candidatus Gottesmanbacteria bacterium RIFCSPHIGHO2_02_FULL_39_14]|uniref:Uncharacterized protein n=3 Tax=Candidatus Gottesmaniibacteriota TaxID=1752720 RepID=A0A1F6A2F0_9BACT|nr:MAG: hypothetical protein A2153_00505 [Candidatus Gottesmanbacteria bacterium RBG_16_38_7b]OGG18843.1 MAG: hypothetical protein A3D78_02400 [Candidatus Gottesmanbacteria bacterium RIFCSPHIGHO2_02_FULL_39_14]OGG31177.1 MAG: hypothetical protein A3I51_00560 [Candidatus Gottesmanbacteria bacterium RIFCSPLOWO2_02_FULL_38_8]